jgi:hypothetical protein
MLSSSYLGRSRYNSSLLYRPFSWDKVSRKKILYKNFYTSSLCEFFFLQLIYSELIRDRGRVAQILRWSLNASWKTPVNTCTFLSIKNFEYRPERSIFFPRICICLFVYLTTISVPCFLWAWCVILCDMCICVSCLIVVPLQPVRTTLAVQKINK